MVVDLSHCFYIRSQSWPSWPMLNIHDVWLSCRQNLLKILPALTTFTHFVSNQNFSRQPITKSLCVFSWASRPATNMGQSMHLNRASSLFRMSIMPINSRTRSSSDAAVSAKKASKTRRPYIREPILYACASVKSLCMSWGGCDCRRLDAQT